MAHTFQEIFQRFPKTEIIISKHTKLILFVPFAIPRRIRTRIDRQMYQRCSNITDFEIVLGNACLWCDFGSKVNRCQIIHHPVFLTADDLRTTITHCTILRIVEKYLIANFAVKYGKKKTNNHPSYCIQYKILCEIKKNDFKSNFQNVFYSILPFSASHFSTSLSRSSQHNPFRSSTGRVPSESLLLQVPSQSPSSVSPSPFRQAWRLLDSRLSTLMAAKIRFEAHDRYRQHVSEEREFQNCSLFV